MLGGVAAHTVNYSINVLKEVFEDRLWPALSPDVNLCDVCLRGNLKVKCIQIIPTQWMNTVKTIASVEISELKLMVNSIFKRLEVCLRTEGRHFEDLL
jgi:hypothetical protein